MKRCLKLTKIQAEELHRIIRNPVSSTKEVRRAQTILLVDAEAEAASIMSLTGYKREHAFKLRRKYLAEGSVGIKDKRKKKQKELLTRKQRAALVSAVKTKKPSDCDNRYDSDYWTTGLLGDYIERTYHVKYKSKTSLYLVFRAAKFTYHKPGRVYERRDQTAVDMWKKETLPILEQAWQDPHTVIVTEDEMHLSSQTTVQKIWLPKGEYPEVTVTKKRESRSIYGFLNIKTGQEHAFKTDWQNMYVTAEILPRVRALYPNKKILLIWDKAGWHKGIEAQKVIQADGHIDTIYFPSAAPEENPQEHVWKNGRSHVTHNRFIENIDTATDDFVSYLNRTTFPYALLGLKTKVLE